jgi:hypothetical protein
LRFRAAKILLQAQQPGSHTRTLGTF